MSAAYISNSCQVCDDKGDASLADFLPLRFDEKLTMTYKGWPSASCFKLYTAQALECHINCIAAEEIRMPAEAVEFVSYRELPYIIVSPNANEKDNDESAYTECGREFLINALWQRKSGKQLQIDVMESSEEDNQLRSRNMEMSLTLADVFQARLCYRKGRTM